MNKILDSIIDIKGDTLPEAWEESVTECWEKGDRFRTEYDKEGDPKSRDCTARISVSNPMAEPRIHRAIPAGIEDLEIYNQEVLYGVHNNWIAPEEGRWEYTYNERLFEYRVKDEVFNQIQIVIDKLSAVPFTRRAQAVTWQVWQDNDCYDPACLQRMWFRIIERKGEKFLNMNVTMRSNDAFKAAFMNMYAFTELQQFVAHCISINRYEDIKVGRYVHYADSYHIYGSYFEEFDGFLKRCKDTDFSSRVIDTESVQYFLDSGKITLFNNTQTDIQMEENHLIRLYDEIPEDRRSELKEEQIYKIF